MNKIMTDYISASDIVARKFVSVHPKEHTKSNGDKYTITSLKYNHGTDDEKLVKPPFFRLEITQARVVYVRDKLRLRVYLSGSEKELKGLAQLNLGYAYCVEKYKHKFGLRNFDPNNPGDLRRAFYHPTDYDGEIIEGALPRMDLKIRYQSVFQIPIGNDEYYTVDPKFIINKEIICSVIFNSDHLVRYSGTPQPQQFVRSCIILGVNDLDQEHTLEEDVTKFIKENAAKVDRLSKLTSKLIGKKVQPDTLNPICELERELETAASAPAPIFNLDLIAFLNK